MELSTTPALPAGARLLHVGIPKTGTTALQRAAATHRTELRAAGLCYPGDTVNHREAVCALMGRTLGWRDAGGAVPPMAAWRRVADEVRAHPGRSLVSHEFAAEADDAQARRFAVELGEGLHVVVTLRSFGSLLGSSWQQYVKTGRRRSFPRWLDQVLADPPAPAAEGFHRRNDQATIVDRWVRLLGPERTVVVVADKRRPDLMTDAFADLLGVPRALLTADPGDGFASNRSLSWPEAELVRRLNKQVGKRELDWPTYDALVRGGGISRLLARRTPPAGERAVALPPWAVERAALIGRGYADRIAASGVRVVGDLDALAAGGRPATGSLKPPRTVPADAAVELAAGLVFAALGRRVGSDSGEDDDQPGSSPSLLRGNRGRRLLASSHRVASVPTADLIGTVGLRAAREVRRRLGR